MLDPTIQGDQKSRGGHETIAHLQYLFLGSGAVSTSCRLSNYLLVVSILIPIYNPSLYAVCNQLPADLGSVIYRAHKLFYLPTIFRALSWARMINIDTKAC